MMEKNRLHEQLPIPRDSSVCTPEQIALKALIDELFRRSDMRIFVILNENDEEQSHE